MENKLTVSAISAILDSQTLHVEILRDMIAEVAKRDIDLFMKVYIQNNRHRLSWIADIYTELDNRRKIGAIRMWRENTGDSLLNSKQEIEQLIKLYYPLWDSPIQNTDTDTNPDPEIPF